MRCLATTRYRRRRRRARRARVQRAPRDSCHAGLEARLDFPAIELAPDEHEAVVAGRAAPRSLELAVEHHVHAVEDVAAVLILEIEDALHAEDVLALALHQIVEPLVELAAVEQARVR